MAAFFNYCTHVEAQATNWGHKLFTESAYLVVLALVCVGSVVGRGCSVLPDLLYYKHPVRVKRRASVSLVK